MLRVISDCYKNQKMCDKVADNYSHVLRLKKKCNEAVSTCLSAIQFVPDQYKTEEICEKAVDICPFVFDSAPD